MTHPAKFYNQEPFDDDPTCGGCGMTDFDCCCQLTEAEMEAERLDALRYIDDQMLLYAI